MCNALTSPDQWAQYHFGLVQLGDSRRNRRAVKIAQNLAAHPGGTLPQAFEEWPELKAAYRFFGQQGVTFENLSAPHQERTRQNCRQPGTYMLIEDTTDLDYSGHPAAQELGVIGDGNGRGFELHSCLAVRIESWNSEHRPQGMVVGLFDQQCRTPRPAPKNESRGQRLSRPRKSQTWTAGFKKAGRPPEGSQWIYVADRESDFYEPMANCQLYGIDFVIRGCQARRLAQEAGSLAAALAQAPVLGQDTVEVRARPGQAARTATVTIRSVRVNLDGPWRPGGWQPPLNGVGVVEVSEVDAPAEVKEPLHWVLLTSLPCATLEQAQKVVGVYTGRWWIEEYHKALKTGAGAQESQLERGWRLEPLMAILGVVAVRLLSTKFLARSRPESMEAASSFGPQLIALLEKKRGKPDGGWTNRNVLVAIARIGGFIGRKSDGMPGWQTIWRGWHRLMWMCEGAELMQPSNRCG